MAVYKVIQDIESEDKLIGPLTLKGFIYAVIAGMCAFISVRLVMSAALGPFKWLIILILLFPMLLFGLLASPIGREQPTEVWLLSRVRFMLKPKKRIWDQSGFQQLVTITAPKRTPRQLTKNLSQTEVKSRLQALATTLDSRGWAVKNAYVNIGAPETYVDKEGSADRLLDASAIPQEVPTIDVRASDDIMDENNNQTAKKLQTMIKKVDLERKQALAERLKMAPTTAAVDSSTLDRITTGVTNPGYTTFTRHEVIAPGQRTDNKDLAVSSTDQEKALLERIHKEEADIHSRAPSFAPKPPLRRSGSTVTEASQAANMELAQTDNVLPLSVASVQQLANRQSAPAQNGQDEVELDLH